MTDASPDGATPDANTPAPKRRRLRRALVAVCLLVVFVLGWFAINRFVSGWTAVRIYRLDDVTTPADDGELTVLSYNIAHGRGTNASNWSQTTRSTRPQRLQDIAAFLRDTDADIVVLNEVDLDCFWGGHINQARLLAQLAGYPYIMDQRNVDMAVPFVRVRFGNAILSRFPISDAERIEYPSPSRREAWFVGHKQGASCIVTLPTGERLRVVAVHLDHRYESTRVESTQRIEALRQRSDESMLLVGDFNSTPLGFPHAQKDRQGRAAVQLIVNSAAYDVVPSPDTAPGKEDMTFPAWDPVQVIDWVLPEKPWRIADRRVLPEAKLSDHRAVWARIKHE